ncbi:MAG: winged helix-turn-helix domain-containing protein [Vicinamibacterales bacterium]
MPTPTADHSSSQWTRFGVFEFDPVSGDVWKNGRSTRLTEQPRQVLEMLLARPGELVTRDQLRAMLWPGDTFVDFDTGLNVVVNKIRKVLGDSASQPRFIETLPRRGYRFVAPVGAVGDRTAPTLGPAALDSVVSAAPVVAAHRGSSLWRASVLAAVAPLLAATLWWVKPVGQPFGTVFSAETPPTAVTRIKSLAVLPLENLSKDPSADYLVSGLAEALDGELAAIRSLTVKSRHSTRLFGGTSVPIGTIGKQLGVDALVRGSLLRTGQTVRLTVELVDVRTEALLWSRAYEHDLGDVALLPREAAAAIGAEVKAAITPAERDRLSRSRARALNPAAFDAHLRGRYLLAGLGESQANTASAMREFNRAVQIDPSYAEAYVGIAEAEQLQATFFGGHATLEPRRSALAAARRAIALDPELGDAHAVLARVQLSEFDWPAATASFARMLELSPGNAPGLVWYSYALLTEGRFDAAIEMARRAEAIDPLNLNTRVRVAFARGFAGRNAESIGKYREILALDPSNLMAGSFIVCSYLREGRNEEALAAAGELLARHGRLPIVLSTLALADGRSGRSAEAMAIIDELIASSQRTYVSPTHLAFAYAGVGDRRRSLEWFQRAYEERSNAMLFFTVDSLFAWPDDPAYVALVKKIQAPHNLRW